MKLLNSRVVTLDYVQMAKKLANQYTKGVSQNMIDNASLELGLITMSTLEICLVLAEIL